jgi:uridine kinase
VQEERSAAVARVNALIDRWRRNRPQLVIALDGYSGVGKSTFLRQLASANPNITPVFLDDFILPGHVRQRKLAGALDRSEVLERQWNNLAKLRRLIQRFRSQRGIYRTRLYDPATGRYSRPATFDLRKPVLAVEGVFMFHPALADSEWDKRIYLDLPLHIADRRRIAREKQRWGDAYVPDSRPDSFVRLFKQAHRRYRRLYNPKRRADVIVRLGPAPTHDGR